MTFGPPSGSVSGIDTLSYLNQNEPVLIKKVIAQRAPTSRDKRGHAYGDIWVDQSTDTIYIFANVTAGAADWVAMAGGSADIDTIHTDSGDVTPSSAAVTIAGTANEIETSGSGSTVTIGIPSTFSIGSTSGAAGGTISVGTGNFSLATAATSTVAIGSAAQTGAITFGQSTAGQTINIGAAINVGAQVVNVASGAAGAASTVNVLSGNASAGTQTLNLATGTGGKTVHVADGAGVNAVTVGSSNSSSATTIQSGTGGLVLSAPAATGVSIGSGGPKLFAGTGSPNGSLSALQGSLFIRTDGTGSNQLLYCNVSSGSGTTWEVFTSA